MLIRIIILAYGIEQFVVAFNTVSLALSIDNRMLILVSATSFVLSLLSLLVLYKYKNVFSSEKNNNIYKVLFKAYSIVVGLFCLNAIRVGVPLLVPAIASGSVSYLFIVTFTMSLNVAMTITCLIIFLRINKT